MPQDVRIAYSQLYDGFVTLSGYRESETPVWAELSKYQWATRLDERDQMEILRDVETLRRINDQIAQRVPLSAPAQRLLRLTAERPATTAATEGFRAGICRPLLAP